MLEMVTVLSHSLNYDSILDRLRSTGAAHRACLLFRRRLGFYWCVMIWAMFARQRGYERVPAKNIWR